ncbi:hypothetical protein BDW60DRAFT_15364 [Aspergillus nidulans var. acristatus]
MLTRYQVLLHKQLQRTTSISMLQPMFIQSAVFVLAASFPLLVLPFLQKTRKKKKNERMDQGKKAKEMKTDRHCPDHLSTSHKTVQHSKLLSIMMALVSHDQVIVMASRL